MPINLRSKRVSSFLAVVAVAAPIAVFSQAGPAANPELQQKLTALKQSVAQNQQALRQYTWTETTDMLLKGESKSKKSAQCKHGPDGKVQKTPLGAQPEAEQARGLKGRIVQNKKDEITEYMERVAALIQSYVPPEGPRMQESFQQGKASITPDQGGIVTLTFRDYAKSGDAVSLVFNTSTSKIQSYSVKSYLDAPADVVTLNVSFSSLVDGTNYVAETVLDATAKQIQIRTTNSNHQKL